MLGVRLILDFPRPHALWPSISRGPASWTPAGTGERSSNPLTSCRTGGLSPGFAVAGRPEPPLRRRSSTSASHLDPAASRRLPHSVGFLEQHGEVWSLQPVQPRESVAQGPQSRSGPPSYHKLIIQDPHSRLKAHPPLPHLACCALRGWLHLWRRTGGRRWCQAGCKDHHPLSTAPQGRPESCHRARARCCLSRRCFAPLILD